MTVISWFYDMFVNIKHECMRECVYSLPARRIIIMLLELVTGDCKTNGDDNTHDEGQYHTQWQHHHLCNHCHPDAEREGESNAVRMVCVKLYLQQQITCQVKEYGDKPQVCQSDWPKSLMASHSPYLSLWYNTLYHLLPQQSFSYLHLYLQPHVVLSTTIITPLHPNWWGYGKSNTSIRPIPATHLKAIIARMMQRTMNTSAIPQMTAVE